MSYLGPIIAIIFSFFIAMPTIVLGDVASPYVITVTKGDNGQITPSTRTFKKGKNAVFTVKPSKRYIIASVTVDGEDIAQSKIKQPWKPYTVRFKRIIADHAISATFAPDVKLSPPFAIMNVGDSQAFKVTNLRGKKLKNAAVTWSSDDQDIASANGEGVVTANKEGKTNVIAVYEGTEDVPSVTAPVAVVYPLLRPQELLAVRPSENGTCSFPLLECDFDDESNPPCLAGPSWCTNIEAYIRLQSGDTLDSAQFTLDGVDVASTISIGMTEDRIICDILPETLSDGIHNASVKAISKSGKEVNYSWSFGILNN